MAPGMKIGDLASVTHCSVPTIRYYERVGLLPPPARSGGNYRLYGPRHVEQLLFIRHSRSLDMTHDEVRTLLAFRDGPEEKCDEVNALLDEHIGHVARRIGELRELEQQLKELRGQCQSARRVRDCAIMQSLGRDSARKAPSRKGHGPLDQTHR